MPRKRNSYCKESCSWGSSPFSTSLVRKFASLLCYWGICYLDKYADKARQCSAQIRALSRSISEQITPLRVCEKCPIERFVWYIDDLCLSCWENAFPLTLFGSCFEDIDSNLTYWLLPVARSKCGLINNARFIVCSSLSLNSNTIHMRIRRLQWNIIISLASN